MKAIEFVGQTDVFGETTPPTGEVEGAVCLPVRAGVDRDGNKVMVSYWKPSPAELVGLAEGAYVCLMVVGEVHPTIALGVAGAEPLP